MAEAQLADCSAHFLDRLGVWESDLLALLETQSSEDELVLSQRASLVTKDVLNLSKLFGKIKSVCFELNSVANAFLYIHHLRVVLHHRREHQLRDLEHGKQIQRHKRVHDQVDAEEQDEVLARVIILLEDVLVLTMVVVPDLGSDGGEDCDSDGEKQVDYHNAVQNLLETAHLVNVLSKVEDQLGVDTGVDNHGDDMARVLNVGATVQELVEGEVLAELRLVGKLGTETAFEVVQFLDRRDAVDEEISALLLRFRSEKSVKIGAYSNVGQLWFQVALSIESRCLHKGLRFLVFNL